MESICGVDELSSKLDISAESVPLKTLVKLALCEKVSQRRVRQGVTLVYAGAEGFFALLIYQNQCLGLFAHRANCDTSMLLDDIKEFRFGWLPNEIVRKQGGIGVAFSGVMPAEAEGFMPTFVVGSKQDAMKGYGVLVHEDIFTTD